MTNGITNHFEGNYPKKITKARTFVKNLTRKRGIYAVAHFDLTSLQKRCKKTKKIL